MKSHRNSILRGTAVVSAFTLLSRALGFLREILVARLFGASMLADALFVAFRIPNLLRSIFAEGALTAAFVPVFAHELAKGESEARDAMRSMVSLLLLATGIVSILGVIFAPEVVMAIAPGFGEGSDRYELCVLLTRILMPYIMCVSIVALLNGALNSVHIFGVSAFAQVIMNLVLIAGALLAAWFEAKEATVVLAISALVGGVLQVAAQIPTLRRSGFSIKPALRMWTRPAREVVHLMMPAVLGAAVYQVSIFLSTQLASILETGSVAWLTYADRLTQLPIGVFSIALSSVLLPTLSTALAAGDEVSYRKSLIDSLRYTSFIMIPLSVFLFAFAEPIVTILFERGNFDHFATLQTALAVQAFTLGLWAVSCHSMLVRAFNARKDTKTPTIVGLFLLFVQLFISLLIMGDPVSQSDSGFEALVRSAQSSIGHFFPRLQLGHAGLALSSSLTFLCSATVLGILTSMKNTGLDWLSFARSSLQSLFASGLALIGLGIIQASLPDRMTFVLVGIPCAFVLHFIFLLLIKNRELQETIVTFQRYIQRRSRRT